MKTIPAHNEIPVARVFLILPYIRLLRSLGAPVERLLSRARVPADLLDHPSVLVPLVNAFRFVELACQAEGTEHLGVVVGHATTLADYGAYGKILQDALTVHDYLQKGISLYNMLMRGQRLALSEHGGEYRFTIHTNVGSGVGAYQSHMENLLTTIAQLKEAAGPQWSPREIGLAYRAREALPDSDLLAGSRIIQGTEESYLTIPGAIMGARFPDNDGRENNHGSIPHDRSLPKDLAGVVKYQIESLDSIHPVRIDAVAKSLAINPRGLQRKLAREGTTYLRLYAEIRMKKAAEWLENSDKPIVEIASDLGYRDASNFTRAFRRHLGISPLLFRKNSWRA